MEILGLAMFIAYLGWICVVEFRQKRYKRKQYEVRLERAVAEEFAAQELQGKSQIQIPTRS